MFTKSKAILLVEDDDNHAELFSFHAKACMPDIEINRMVDGEEVLQFLKENNLPSFSFPEIIFLDLNLPKFSGYEVLRSIKSHPLAKRIPTIIFSSSTAPSDISSVLAAGANGYIHKPLYPADFRELISNALNYWKLNERDQLIYGEP